MKTAHITYQGKLRTEAIHTRSKQTIFTDAPVDNQGKGEAFSPTDLLATSLATCAVTTMGILAEKKGIPFTNVHADVVKEMGGPPRKVQGVSVEISMDGAGLDSAMREELEHTGRNCPVALSLHKDLVQKIGFKYL